MCVWLRVLEGTASRQPAVTNARQADPDVIQVYDLQQIEKRGSHQGAFAINYEHYGNLRFWGCIALTSRW